MRYPNRLLGLALVVVLSLAAVGQAAPGDDDRKRVLLGQGKLGQFEWRSFARRDKGPGGARRPCIEAVLEFPSGPNPSPIDVGSSSSEVCGKLFPDFPNLPSVGDGEGRREKTVLAMAFVTEARRVHLDLGPRGERDVLLRLLSERKAEKARVRPFRYAARGFSGPFCLRRFTSYDKHGRQLSDSGVTPCGVQ